MQPGESLYDERYIELTHYLEQALKAQPLFHRDKDYMVTRRRGHHRRRVHRPHDARPPLVRGVAPGDRGQGRRPRPPPERHPGDDHLPELLPHVQQAGRHDRHGQDRGGRVPPHLQPRRGRHPDQPADGPRRLPRLVFKNEEGKFRAVIAEIEEKREQGRPVLVGTTSIEKSERLSRSC